MAHEIFTENGQASMFYVGGKPWHKLGTELKTPPATAEEAIRAARLDWPVVKVPLYGAAGTRLVPIPDAHAIVRADRWGTDQCDVFGLVGDDYTPVQNLEAFQFFDAVIKAGSASYHTAGALGRGERIWILVEMKGDIEVAPDDKVGKYVLLSNSHDGRSSLHLKFTPVRVVCANTLTLALSSGPAIRIPHKRDVHNRLRAAGVQLGLHDYVVRPTQEADTKYQAEEIQRLLSEGFQSLSDTFSRMAECQLAPEVWTAYFSSVFPDPEQPDSQRAAAMARARALASHLGRHGQGNTAEPVRQSLWAAYNGVTEFLDHRGASLNDPSRGAADKHLHSIWFGQAANMKARAFRRATEMLSVPEPVTV